MTVRISEHIAHEPDALVYYDEWAFLRLTPHDFAASPSIFSK
jgi:hypothetical protein